MDFKEIEKMVNKRVELPKEGEVFDNAQLQGLRLQTVVNHAYDCPGADDPSRLTSKCIRTLLIPRVIDVICFYLFAVVFVWTYRQTGAKEFAKRIFGTDVGAELKSALTDSMTILLTVGFAAVTAGVFVLRILYITAKRRKRKEDMEISKQCFPWARINKAGLFVSTIVVAALMMALYFIASLVLKNSMDLTKTMDLYIVAGLFAALNLWACLKVKRSSLRCPVCHVIANMKDQKFEVTERYYSDVTRNEPNTRYKSTKNTYRGDHLVSSESSIHESGGVYKYLDVRHDRNVESCKCPYCLQVYKQTGVIINDDLDQKECVYVGSYSTMY